MIMETGMHCGMIIETGKDTRVSFQLFRNEYRRRHAFFNMIRKPAKITGHDQETGMKRPAGECMHVLAAGKVLSPHRK